jgi:hypothetical protein
MGGRLAGGESKEGGVRKELLVSCHLTSISYHFQTNPTQIQNLTLNDN